MKILKNSILISSIFIAYGCGAVGQQMEHGAIESKHPGYMGTILETNIDLPISIISDTVSPSDERHNRYFNKLDTGSTPRRTHHKFGKKGFVCDYGKPVKNTKSTTDH